MKIKYITKYKILKLTKLKKKINKYILKNNILKKKNNTIKQNGGAKTICTMKQIGNKLVSLNNNTNSTFFIYTTGLNDKNQIIPFYFAILKSAINLSIPNSITKILITHYDNFNNLEIKELSTEIHNTISSKITSNIIKYFLTLKDIESIKSNNYIIFDFAHMSNGGADHSIPGFLTNIKMPIDYIYGKIPDEIKYNCIIFGYYDDHYIDNEKYLNIISKCKFFDVNVITNKITTYRDRGIIYNDKNEIVGNLFGNDPSIFGSLSDCENTKTVITIPYVRIIDEQEFGLESEVLYNEILFKKNKKDEFEYNYNTIITYINEQNNILVNNIFEKRKALLNHNINNTNKCLLCTSVNCNKYDLFDLKKTDNKILCTNCNNADTIKKMYKYVVKKNPKQYHPDTNNILKTKYNLNN